MGKLTREDIILIKIDFNIHYLEKKEVMCITQRELIDFYGSASKDDRYNLVFVLMNTFNVNKQENAEDCAAHTASLLAFYLFVLLTPCGSEEISMYYINEAIKLNPSKENQELKVLIEKGN